MLALISINLLFNVHTKRRNSLKQKPMNDVVFVTANSRLAKKKKGRRTPEMKFDGLGSDDDWVMNESAEDGGTKILDGDFV